jgi:hypothetical protein
VASSIAALVDGVCAVNAKVVSIFNVEKILERIDDVVIMTAFFIVLVVIMPALAIMFMVALTVMVMILL